MLQRLFLLTCMIALSFRQIGAQAISVWPGDANNNGVVNNIDLLNLGLGYNFFGPARDTVNSDWAAESATPWNFTFPDGSNFAHADCNGDGLINYLYDAFPVYVHYGNTHGVPVYETYQVGVPGVDVPLFFDSSAITSPVEAGTQVELPLILGTPEIPVEDLYGIAFSVHIDTQAMDVDQMQLDFSQASWANPDFDRIYGTYRASDTRMDVAWVRTDRNNRSGNGQIGKLSFIIIDDVISLQKPDFQLRIDSIRMIDRFGNQTTVTGQSITIPLKTNTSNSRELPDAVQLKMGPVPLSGTLYIEASEIIHNIRLLDAAGKEVAHTSPAASQTNWVLPKLREGFYVCELQVGKTIIRRKVIVLDHD